MLPPESPLEVARNLTQQSKFQVYASRGLLASSRALLTATGAAPSPAPTERAAPGAPLGRGGRLMPMRTVWHASDGSEHSRALCGGDQAVMVTDDTTLVTCE